jgi:hypothetical protein
MKKKASDTEAAERRRKQHLRVPVTADEKVEIERRASQAGLSVARYLREVGAAYEIRGVVDLEQVREMARINGDLGRLGGLLKMWLTDHPRAAVLGEERIREVLRAIERRQAALGEVMQAVVRPRAKRN